MSEPTLSLLAGLEAALDGRSVALTLMEPRTHCGSMREFKTVAPDVQAIPLALLETFAVACFDDHPVEWFKTRGFGMESDYVFSIHRDLDDEFTFEVSANGNVAGNKWAVEATVERRLPENNSVAFRLRTPARYSAHVRSDLVGCPVGESWTTKKEALDALKRCQHAVSDYLAAQSAVAVLSDSLPTPPVEPVSANTGALPADDGVCKGKKIC